MRKKDTSPKPTAPNLAGTAALHAPSVVNSHRRRIYRILFLLGPFIFLILLELILRAASFGYPTSFFLEKQLDGKKYLIQNDQFGWRFFPPEQARTPQPMRIREQKEPGIFRIVVLGESAAMGDPEPAFGFARFLETILNAPYPSKRVEVINAAMTAINSHAILPIAQDCVRLNADAWIIYMGNNEVVGPYGSGTVFGPKAPPLALIRTVLWLKTLKIGQAFERFIQRCFQRNTADSSWGGMEMFLQSQVRADAPQMQKVYHHFQANLRDIVNMGRQSGAAVFISSIAVNLKDCAPFASLHKNGLTEADLKRWQTLITAGETALKEQRFNEALQEFSHALKLDDHYANLHFQMADCYERNGNIEKATESYQKALEWDTLRFRADATINQMIRKVAEEMGNKGVFFCDAEKQFRDSSTNGLPGKDVFWEHVHFNPQGNYSLARFIADNIIANTTQKSGVILSSLTSQAAFARLALTDWERYRLLQQMEKRLEQPPFTRQLNHSNQLQFLHQEMTGMNERIVPDALKQQLASYVTALDQNPDDCIIRGNYAEVLEETGDLSAALHQWTRVSEQMPHLAEALFKQGNILDKQGESDRAIPFFEKALVQQPTSTEALNGLGLCHLNRERHDVAIGYFEKAIRLSPSFMAARVNHALALWKKGSTQDAEIKLKEALQIQTNHLAARVNLGKLYKELGRIEESLEQYQQAVRLHPEEAVARFNLANTLASLKRNVEALEHYTEAVRLSPDFAEARLNLGLELSRAGRNAEALAQLSVAAKLAPNNFEIVLNNGVALARQKRYAEAQKQIEAAIKLNPNDAGAHLNLGMVYMVQNAIDKAAAEFESVLRLDPGNRSAKEYLERIANRSLIR